MATITSAGSGLASATSTWVGGVVPVEGDKVIIAAGHVVELDGHYTWGDDSVTATIPNAAVNISGTLKASRTVSSSLTGKGLILSNYGTKGFDFGTDADPISNPAVTAHLILNKAAVPASRYGMVQVSPASGLTNIVGWSFVGYDGRKRGVKLAANTSASADIVLVDVDHGWIVGDSILLFKTTNASALDECELRTVVAIAGDIITLNAAPTYMHKAGSPACNMTSNVCIRSYNEINGQMAQVAQNIPSYLAVVPTEMYFTYKNVEMRNIGAATVATGFFTSSNGGPDTNNYGFTVHKCTFLNNQNDGSIFNNMPPKPTYMTECVAFVRSGTHYGSGQCVWQRSWLALGLTASNTAFTENSGTTHEDLWITVRGGNISAISPSSMTLKRCTFSGRGTALLGHTVGLRLIDCDLGYTYGWSVPYGGDWIMRMAGQRYALANISLENCLLNPVLSKFDDEWDISNQSDTWQGAFINKNNDVTVQEVYYGTGKQLRNNAEIFRSASSISFKPFRTNGPLVRTKEIPCGNGQTIRIVGYVKADTAFYNGGGANWTPPTVTISGLGITPVVFTASAAANNAWEQFDLSATNTAGYDGNLTLTYTANAKAVTTGTVYFDGIPDAPFVTQCRHYGFDLTQETSPTRTVDPYVVATEATAAAYTGITIDGTAKTIGFGAGTGDTAQEFYDYTRAWACLNLDKDIPLNRAGALYSLATGWTVIDPTYSGLTWGGGKVEWSAVGSKSGSFDSNQHVFAAAGAYDMGNCVFSGTVEFVNSSGGNVVVIVPEGTDYINTGPNITVNIAVDQAEALISGIVAGSRLQIYNVTTATEMVNAINATTSYSLGYPNGTDYSAGDVVRVRLTYCVGITAKLPVEYVTIASAAGWSVLANQQDDGVYIANGIDGSTVTEYSSDYANVQIDVSDPDGVTSIQRGYAWYCDQMTGDDGIRYFFGAFQAEDAFNYLLNTDVADIKIQNTGTTGVTLTGGAVRRKDGSSPIAPGGSVYIYYGRTYGLETGTSGLTPTEADKLLSLPDAAGVWSHPTRTLTSGGGGTVPTAEEVATAVLALAQVTPIHADMKKTNGQTLIGDGSEGNRFRSHLVP